MNRKGNMIIGKAKRYDAKTRNEITKVIKKEWKAIEKENPSSDDFAKQAKDALAVLGFKSPNGTPLTIRGVKYQVMRSGIKFKGRLSRAPRAVRTVTTPKAPLIRESREDRLEMVQSLSSIPTALRGILEDDRLTPKQRTAMFAAYFELEPKL